MQTNYYKYINYIIAATTLVIIVNFGQFVIEKSSVQYSDWLINYQGGFVRRGLPGEIFYQLHYFTKIQLDFIVFIFVAFFYILFGYFLTKFLKNIKLNLLNFLIIFSPLSFFYPVMEQKVSGRKDIIFTLSIITLVMFLEKIKFENQKYFIILLTLLTTFSHSGFFVYVPLFFLIFIILNHQISFKKIFKEIFFISIACLVLFFIIIFNTSINSNSIIDICNSVNKYLPNCGVSDYISTLNWSLKYEIELVTKIWNKENYISFYILAFFLANTPLIYLFTKSEFSNKNYSKFNPIIIFILINFCTIPIYYIGADYGRYMHITYLSLMLIYFKGLSNKFFLLRKTKKNYNKFLFVIIFLYGFTWTIPHCCNNNFKFIYQKPISKIIDLNIN